MDLDKCLIVLYPQSALIMYDMIGILPDGAMQT